MSQTYDALNKEWKGACKVIFGEEVGELATYEEWLSELNEPLLKGKSSAKGTDVVYAVPLYPKGAKLAGLDEIDFERKYPPLSINEIKDIDSAIAAVKERIAYTGSIILGNSGFVEGSSNVSDSYFVYKSGKVDSSKYVAYCSDVRLSDHAFGCIMLGRGNEYTVKIQMARLAKRCFETWGSNGSADCYYVSGCDACHDCIFSFNIHSKAFCIGNLELPREKYTEVKSHLLGQLSSELMDKKKLPSLIEIIGKCRGKPPMLECDEQLGVSPPGQNKEIMEEAFAKACSVVLGKRIGKMDEYSAWLEKNIHVIRHEPSVMSGKSINFPWYKQYEGIPRNRIVRLEEAHAIENSIRISEKDALSLDLHNAHGKVGGVAYMTPEKREGIFQNNIGNVINIDSVDCYCCSQSVESKSCGYCFWPRNSEYIFGCDILFQSSFCLKCHNSVKLRACFECDSCRDCSGCYFCHNVENCQDCLLCFNVKNKKYAIGNAEVGREAYLRVKSLVLAEIAAKLEKAKTLEYGIYNIGCARKGKAL